MPRSKRFTPATPQCKATLNLPAVLIILDGCGVAAAGPGNAVTKAATPYIDSLMATSPHVLLAAGGPAVGLPEGQMGNSEVGHLNIGAGRVVNQELTRINLSMRDGSFFENPVLCEAIDTVVADGRAVHVMGLLSDGGVHSEQEHLEAVVRLAVSRGARTVYVHAFLDGRDVPPRSARGNLSRMDVLCKGLTGQTGAKVRIATVVGRYYAMDRDKRWDRVERAWDVIVLGRGTRAASAVSSIESDYANDVGDEFAEPMVIEGETDYQGVCDGDAVLFMNFRPDRARQLARAFVDPDFNGFVRERIPQVHFVCLTEYDPSIPAQVAFPKACPSNVLADVLADAGLRQLHTAETEKYAHVTFFLNGGVEAPRPGEERVLVPSPKVATYDLQPEMSAPEVGRRLAQAIADEKADVYIVNFANCDMVGHTGSIPAAIEAVQAVDREVARVVEAVRMKHGVVLLTADHGNADCMLAEDGTPYTAHSLAPVPLVLVDATGKVPAHMLKGVTASSDATSTSPGGFPALSNIAPTFVDLIGLDRPAEWTAESLLM